jgi:hypothetical protein
MDPELYPIARRSERINASIPITLLVDADGKKTSHDAFTVDLSQLGVRIRSKIVLAPGQAVDVIPNEGPRYAVPSRVIWVGQAGVDSQAGLEFLSPLTLPA